MTIYHFLTLGLILFLIGVYGVITRRNAIGILMGVELMFNGANINLVAFNKFIDPNVMSGQIFVIFVITLAAAEAAVGLALILSIYRHIKTIYVEKMDILKG